MKKKIIFVFMTILLSFVYAYNLCAQKENEKSDSPIYAVVGERHVTPFPSDDATQKILRRNALQNEGYYFSERGLYDQALTKFQEAIQPTLLNTEHDKSTALWAILKVHQRQGKLEIALEELNLIPKINQQKDSFVDEKLELKALIDARNTSFNKPIYEHIKYLKEKYKKYIPPQSKGDSGFHTIPINDIIHLYNWMGDADGGIQFMNEVLSSKTLYPEERKDYERVKAAFEEDKRTGQKGHLQKVIETSDIIGW